MIAIVGWGGAALLLAAYALVSVRRLEGRSAAFQILNLLGSGGLATNSAANDAWPSAVLNLIWMAIGVATLGRAILERRARS